MARPLCFQTLWWVCALAVVAAGCADDPWTYPARDSKTVGEEVFRVFCKRAAKSAVPNDLSGYTFDPACPGEGPAPISEPRLDALLQRLGIEKFAERRDHRVENRDTRYFEPAAAIAQFIA